MIRILFFTEYLGTGGAEKVLCDLVNHMDQTKFDITVQTVWPYDSAAFLAPGIHYKSVYPARNGLFKNLYRVEAALGTAYHLHIRKDYDIECAFLEMGPTKVMARSSNKKAVHVAWVHTDFSNAISNHDKFEAKTGPWYGKYDQIICVSETAKRGFDQVFHHRFPTRVAHNVVDDVAIREKSMEKIDESPFRKPLVVSLGSLYYPKNYLRLLRIHKRLLEDGIFHDLWILGEGVDRPKLEQFIRDNGLEKTVHLPGYVKNPYPYLKKADLLVCSSIYEGFSTFITEGVIIGRPIVTTECSGMREILGDSEYGLITDNDEESLYLGMKRMLADQELRQHYAEQARKRGEDFSMTALVRNDEKMFEELAGKKKR